MPNDFFSEEDDEILAAATIGVDSKTKQITPPPATATEMAKMSSKAMTDLITGTVAKNNATLDQRYGVVKNLQAEKQAANEDQIVQAATIGDNNKIVKSAQLLADQEAQRRTVVTAANMGVTGSQDTADLLNTRAAQWKAASEDALAKKDKLREDSEIQFLQNPAGYIRAQFYMENTAREAQNAEDKKIQIAQDIVQVQGMTQEAAKTYNAIKQTTTAASVKASLDIVEAETKTGINTLKAANAGILIQDLAVLNGLDSAKLSNLNVAAGAKMDLARLGIAYEQLSLSKQSIKMQADEFRERMDLKKVTKEELDVTGQLLSEGLAIIGRGKGEKIPSTMVAGLFKTPEGQEAYTRAIQSRLVGSPVVASSLGELTRIVGKDGAPLMPQQSAIRNLLGSSFAIASDETKAKEYGIKVTDHKNLQDVQSGAAQLVTQQATEYLKNIKPGDKSNPYSAPPYSTVMEIPGVQQSPLYQKVLKPQHAAGGIQEFNPQNVVASVAAGIKAGTITHAEGAQGLLAMFNGIVKTNQIQQNYMGMHLPQMDGYRTTIISPGGTPAIRNMNSLPDINVILDQQLRPVGMFEMHRNWDRPLGFN